MDPCELPEDVRSTALEAREWLLPLVVRAGEETLRHFGRPLGVELKADRSPVTVADRRAEEILRAGVAAKFSDHGILGEEAGHERPDAPWQWIFDPIDGTKSFVHGVPLYSTLAALAWKGLPVLGVVHLPALGRTLDAVLGEGCRDNGVTCRVSTVCRLEDATLLDGCTPTVDRSPFGAAWRSLREEALLHRGWGDAYGYFLVATGCAEAMFDPVVSPWDIAPLPVILGEAGGRFTDADGAAGLAATSGLGTNGLLHELLLARLGQVHDTGMSA